MTKGAHRPAAQAKKFSSTLDTPSTRRPTSTVITIAPRPLASAASSTSKRVRREVTKGKTRCRSLQAVAVEGGDGDGDGDVDLVTANGQEGEVLQKG